MCINLSFILCRVTALPVIQGWLITIQHCLSCINLTHDAMSMCSVLVSVKQSESLKNLVKQRESRMLLDFYDFFFFFCPQLLTVVLSTPNKTRIFIATQFHNFLPKHQLGFHRNNSSFHTHSSPVYALLNQIRSLK